MRTSYAVATKKRQFGVEAQCLSTLQLYFFNRHFLFVTTTGMFFSSTASSLAWDIYYFWGDFGGRGLDTIRLNNHLKKMIKTKENRNLYTAGGVH